MACETIRVEIDSRYRNRYTEENRNHLFLIAAEHRMEGHR